MNRVLYFVYSCFFLLLISCNDGDIIVTSFNFDDQEVNYCFSADDVNATKRNYIFYKLNSDTKETLSFSISTANPIFSVPSGNTDYSFSLTSDKSAIYRIYDGIPGNDYFCSQVPPSTPQVAQEYISTEGTVTIATYGDKDDNDGIPAEVELNLAKYGITIPDSVLDPQDWDGDGILNNEDADDDGDNVPTASELPSYANESFENARNTDQDALPNFLDTDDDGDGVLTINEDRNKDLDPTNDTFDPNIGDDYLNNEVAEDFNIKAYRLNTFIYKEMFSLINLKNLVFKNQDASETLRQQSLFFGRKDLSNSGTLTEEVPFND